MSSSKQKNWDKPKIVAKYKAESINGISFNLWKTALQKYARNGKIELGLGTLNILKHVTEQKMKSNLLNRMILMMTEDVNINNATLPIAMKKLYLEFKDTGDFSKMQTMYILLCNSNKCRLIHDMKSTYALTPYYMKDVTFYENEHKKMAPEHNEMYEFTYTSEETLSYIRVYLNDEIIEERFISLEYLSYYIRNRYIALSGAQKLWKLLHEIVKNKKPIFKEIIESLRYFYVNMSHEEKIYYLYQAFLTVIYRDILDLTPVDYSDIDVNEIDQKFPLKDNMFTEEITTITEENDDIVNECTDYKNETWRNYYNTFKQLLSLYNENILEESTPLDHEETVLVEEEYENETDA